MSLCVELSAVVGGRRQSWFHFELIAILLTRYLTEAVTRFEFEEEEDNKPGNGMCVADPDKGTSNLED